MSNAQGTLQVRGTGRVQVAPDEAVVQLGVVTEARTAADAAASNARQTQAVINAVASQPNHDVTTTGLSVNPIYSYDPNVPPGTIVAFRATNGVEVKTKVDYAAQVYDAGVQAGANQSRGITFRVQNEAPHREEALRLAVEIAYREALIVAKAARVELDGAASIQVDPGGGRAGYQVETGDAKALSTPALPEERTITAGVQIVFRTRGQLGCARRAPALRA